MSIRDSPVSSMIERDTLEDGYDKVIEPDLHRTNMVSLRHGRYYWTVTRGSVHQVDCRKAGLFATCTLAIPRHVLKLTNTNKACGDISEWSVWDEDIRTNKMICRLSEVLYYGLIYEDVKSTERQDIKSLVITSMNIQLYSSTTFVIVHISLIKTMI